MENLLQYIKQIFVFFNLPVVGYYSHRTVCSCQRAATTPLCTTTPSTRWSSSTPAPTIRASTPARPRTWPVPTPARPSSLCTQVLNTEQHLVQPKLPLDSWKLTLDPCLQSPKRWQSPWRMKAASWGRWGGWLITMIPTRRSAGKWRVYESRFCEDCKWQKNKWSNICCCAEIWLSKNKLAYVQFQDTCVRIEYCRNNIT